MPARTKDCTSQHHLCGCSVIGNVYILGAAWPQLVSTEKTVYSLCNVACVLEPQCCMFEWFFSTRSKPDMVQFIYLYGANSPATHHAQ